MPASPGRLDPYFVVPVDLGHDGLDLVEAVRPLAGDQQAEVELGGGPHQQGVAQRVRTVVHLPCSVRVCNQRTPCSRIYRRLPNLRVDIVSAAELP